MYDQNLSDEMPGLFGRTKITSCVDAITDKNVVKVLNKCLPTHGMNRTEIDYLMRYMRGEQPILQRKKTVREEINNKVVENHAYEIVHFLSSYFLGEPCTYIRRGADEAASEKVELLNNYMFAEDKASCDKELASNMFCCGQGYRMILPDKSAGVTDDESPFEIDSLDPRNTFVVYHSGFGSKRLMSCTIVKNEKDQTVHCVYTPTMYYEIINNAIATRKKNPLGEIPVIEYVNNAERMGAFEPVIAMLDELNNISSNRADAVEQFVQSFLKFVNCDIDTETFKELKEAGAIKIKSVDGNQADVDIISSELNQDQTQTLIDYTIEQIYKICGMPTSTKGLGGGTSGNVGSVIMHAGWQQCEARMKDTELLFKKSEKQFLKIVAKILRDLRGVDIKLTDVDLKFVRRQYEDMITKTQSLLSMLQAGIAPEVAIAECGKFNDPQDVYARSKPFLTKWDYIDLTDLTATDESGGVSADEEAV